MCPRTRSDAVQGLIMNACPFRVEYDPLALLPAAVPSKTRFSVPSLGADVFEGPLSGLVLAGTEVSDAGGWLAFVPPAWCVAEVTDDVRFGGGILVSASRRELSA